MLKTNYDVNSKGLNIEVSAFLDIDASRMNFEENIEILQHSNYQKYSVGFYTCSGELEKPEINDVLTVKGSTKNIKRYLIKECYLYKENIQNDDRESVSRELISQLDIDWNDIVRDDFSIYKSLDGYNINISLNTKEYNFIETRGYCQGDYATCIVKNSYYYIPNKEEIDNLYWDCPIYFRVTINDVELDESDILEGICKNEYDTYNYDKEKVIAKILSLDCIKKLNKDNEIKEELEKLIPDRIEYQ